jgi:hypothetical protein
MILPIHVSLEKGTGIYSKQWQFFHFEKKRGADYILILKIKFQKIYLHVSLNQHFDFFPRAFFLKFTTVVYETYCSGGHSIVSFNDTC